MRAGEDRRLRRGSRKFTSHVSPKENPALQGETQAMLACNLQVLNGTFKSSGSHLTQIGSGRVHLPSSLEIKVAVMFCMTEPHREQIICWGGFGALEVRSFSTSGFIRLFQTREGRGT